MMMYIGIFLAKVVEVTLATTRIVLITKGERVKGALIGLIESLIWVTVVSAVLIDITSDPMKVVAYALGFSLGNYVGSRFEERLGIGTTRVEVIVKEEDGKELVKNIRSHGFAVTVLDGEGMNYKRKIMIAHIKRRRTKEFIAITKNYQDNAVITISEIKPIYGGYGVIRK